MTDEATSADRIVAAIDRLTAAVERLAATTPDDGPTAAVADEDSADAGSGRQASNQPEIQTEPDHRVVGLYPAPGWRASFTSPNGYVIDFRPIVGWSVGADGIVRPAVADDDGRVLVLDPGDDVTLEHVSDRDRPDPPPPPPRRPDPRDSIYVTG